MAEDWWELPLACLDTETTGVDAREARILEVALVEIGPEGKVLGGLHRLCRVDVPIPPEAAAVHGITAERLRVEGADPTEVIAQALLQLGGYQSAGRPVVIFNAPFDWGLIQAEAARYGLGPPSSATHLLDPLCMDRHLDRYRSGGRQLEKMAAHYGVPVAKAHSAVADAVAAVGILRALARRFPLLRQYTPHELFVLQPGWHAAWRDSMNDYWARIGRESRITGVWPGRLPPAPAAEEPAAASGG